MHIGFSGTRDGMTAEQLVAVGEFLSDNPHFSVAHHGDCVGADDDFHKLVRIFGLQVIGHPPTKNDLRSFCIVNESRTPKDYITRDHDIVDESELMLFTPAGFEEVLRSGTWATIRYTRKIGRPGLIFWPDGAVDDV